MKTAYELAMERMGGGLKNYTDEQKKALAEIDRLFDAKVAEARIGSEKRLAKAGDDAAKQDEVRDSLKRELASLEGKREKEKEAIRGRV